MKITSLCFYLIIFTIFSSCAPSTLFTDVYLDESYKDLQIKKILVIGLAKEEWRRKVYENEFRSLLLQHKIDVLTAWQELPKNESLNRETFEKYFKDKNVDAVLVVIEGGETTEKTMYSGVSSNVYVGFYGFYVSTAPLYYNSGYLAEDKTVHMRANLYETKDAKLIWSARSHSYEPESTGNVIKTVGGMVTNEFYNIGFIK